jgi:hypothetical protein
MVGAFSGCGLLVVLFILWIVVEFGGNAHWWLGSGHYSLLSSLTTQVSIIDEWGFSNFLV